MTTPHRALPPPAAMALSSPPGSNPSLGQLPQPWPGSDESLKTWLQAKTEEEKRRAEEERTRQEQLRGDTRRVELEMLKELLKYGVPPALIPLMFMGPGFKTSGGEWVQDYVAHQMSAMQQHQQQQQPQQRGHPAGQHPMQHAPVPSSPPGPSLRREIRSIHQIHQQATGMNPTTSSPAPPSLQPSPSHHHQSQSQAPPPPPSVQQQPVGHIPGAGNVPVGPPSQPPPPPQGYITTYQLPNTGAIPRSGSQSQPTLHQGQSRSGGLPRINTGELQIQHVHPSVPGQMTMGPPPAGSTQASQQGSIHQETAAPAPSQSIFFHHWVPPHSQTSSGASSSAQATASPQRQLDSPFTHHPPPNVLSTASDYGNSPKKRKSMASQPQQPPPPSSQPFSPQPHHLSSPAVSTPSRIRRGHSRNRSDTSTAARIFESYTRPTTRQRRSIGASDMSPVGESTHSGRSHQYRPMSTGGDNGGSTNIAPHTQDQEYRQQDREREMDRERERERDPDRDRERTHVLYSPASDARRPPYTPNQPPEAGSDKSRGDL